MILSLPFRHGYLGNLFYKVAHLLSFKQWQKCLPTTLAGWPEMNVIDGTTVQSPSPWICFKKVLSIPKHCVWAVT